MGPHLGQDRDRSDHFATKVASSSRDKREDVAGHRRWSNRRPCSHAMTLTSIPHQLTVPNVWRFDGCLTDLGGAAHDNLSGRQESRKKEDKQYYQQDKQMGLEHEELSGSIIGAAIEVHKALGPGFLESVYGHALALELVARGIRFERTCWWLR